ncbi:MAG: hypothetical protein KY445_02030 [Armatimonadetes bacterium]|nr:hypothetical protein [Armatimonadota bacterium]
MNRKEIQQLQQMREYPSLSVLAPTHRTAPDNQQDPIRVKNLVTEATSRLLDEFAKREIEPLLERLDFLVEEIDWRYTLDGVALFANKDFAARFDLPFSPMERVAIDETFATRDLVFALNRSPRYYVLVLSEQPTRLFEASRDKLEEVRTGNFPLEHTGPGGATAMPGGHGVQQSAHRDEYDRQFFRKVDEELSNVLADDPLPIVVTGVTRNLAFWDELSANKTHIAGTLEGSHDSTNHHELGQLVWPIMQEYMATQRAEVLERLGDAIGAKKYAAGMGECWQMAQEGRGEVLIVEEDFHYPGQLHPCGLLMPAETDLADADFMGDAVDDLIECVLDKGGRVVFVDNGSLETHGRIAMITRY